MPDAACDDWTLLNERTPQALHELFQRHKDFVYRVALSRLGCADSAEDATQDVFMRLLTARRRFFAGAKFRTLLYRITNNIATDRLRRRGRLVPLEQSAGEPAYRDPYDARITLERAIVLLNQLPTRQREAVLLREFEGLTTPETAELLGISIGSVKTHLHRGLLRLRELLDQAPHQTQSNKEITT